MKEILVLENQALYVILRKILQNIVHQKAILVKSAFYKNQFLLGNQLEMLTEKVLLLTFMKIMSTPGDIEDTLEGLCE